MTLTLEELKEHLVRDGDVEFLIDVLQITMEELVETLTDHIEEKFDTLVEEYDLIESDTDEV